MLDCRRYGGSSAERTAREDIFLLAGEIATPPGKKRPAACDALLVGALDTKENAFTNLMVGLRIDVQVTTDTI